MESIEDCFEIEGRDANITGYERDECPYEDGTDGREGWLKGWDKCDEENDDELTEYRRIYA
jgi:ribosome modulation factor